MTQDAGALLKLAEVHLEKQHKWLSDQFDACGRIRDEGSHSADIWDQIEATYALWKQLRQAASQGSAGGEATYPWKDALLVARSYVERAYEKTSGDEFSAACIKTDLDKIDAALSPPVKTGGGWRVLPKHL